jgi:hypothetical protein
MKTEDMPVLALGGDARTRGRIHGEARRAAIRTLLGVFRDELQRTHDRPAQELIHDFVSNTDFLSAMARWTPELIEEIHGIADGSDAAFQDILVLNLIDELWCYGFKTMASQWKGPFNKCTCAGGVGNEGQPTVMGQNLDISPWYDGYQTLLKIKEAHGGESLVFTVAGVIALNGLSSNGFGVCVNSLLQLDHRSTGLPVSCVIRGTLLRQNLADAESFVRSVSHASGQNYILSGYRKIVSLECSANRVERFVPPEATQRMWHTNHPLANDDTAHYESLIAGISKERTGKSLNNTEARLAAVKGRFSDAQVPITVGVTKEALSSRDDPKNPVSTHYDPKAGVIGFTAGCQIFEFYEEDKPVLHVTAGPPDTSEFMTFRF